MMNVYVRNFFKKIVSGMLMTGSLASADTSSTSTPRVLIMLGPPGAGKGTQAKMLEGALHLPHISTGDLLRDHVKKGSELGKQAQDFMEKGQLVPDALILDMLFDRVSQKDCAQGYILDGFPRTLPQAKALQERLKGQPAPITINLDLSDAKIIERLSNRVVCEKCGTPYHLLDSPPKKEGVCDKCSGKVIQRGDDNKEVITKRLHVYHQQTAPLIAFYTEQKLLHTVSCEADRDTVFSQVLNIIIKK